MKFCDLGDTDADFKYDSQPALKAKYDSQPALKAFPDYEP